MASILIRLAVAEEAPALSALAMRSKAHWEYDQAFLDACRESLTLDPTRCDGERVLVAETNGRLAGFAQLAGSPPVGELVDMWVDPDAMGLGVGRALFEAIVQRAMDLGFRSFTIDSDPGAERFYRHMGAVRIGETPSTVDPTRLLPLLVFRLDG